MMQNHTMDDQIIHLSEGVKFTKDEQGRPGAEVKRGQAVTRFKIDPHIQTFLECFRTPLTLRQAAEVLKLQGFETENVIQFGKKLLKTPLLEFLETDLAMPPAATLLAQAGLHLVETFKDRKFDGVYRVQDANGQSGVVKLLRSTAGMSESERILKRMENEHAVLQRLADVSAVVATGPFIDCPRPHFVMEFIDGVTLTDAVMHPRCLSWRMRVAHDAVAALAAVHRRGIIHGDVHASNFMIDAALGVRVIDFDCAFVDGNGYLPRIGGAAHFMPPERASGVWHAGTTVPADIASDIYQLGIVLYLTLRGVPPFRGGHYAELTDSIRTGTYAALGTTREQALIDPAVCAAVHACMAFKPEHRPASLDDILPVFVQSIQRENAA